MSDSLPPRSRQQHEEVDAEGSWAISYGDMITLLLTFFILFFNVDKRDTEQRLAVQETLLKQFKPSSAAQVQIGTERKPASIDENEINSWGARTFKVGERIVIEFPNVSFFGKGSTDVEKTSTEKLIQFAKLYTPYMGQNLLSVKAFTDTLQVSGGHRYHDNLELSALRAISAMRILQKAGLPLQVMRISGNGEFSNINSQLTHATTGDPLARKVVLVIEPLTKEKL
jgi:flagellar motor protein MotB